MQLYRLVLFLLLMGLLSACGDTGSSLTGAPAVSATQSVQKFNSTASSQEQVQKAFIAYYGRPADPSGLSYWATQLDTAGGNWSAIIESFGNSSEATALLAGLTNEQKIDKLYTQMFGRSADSGGRTYYANGLSNGSFTLASLAVNIINGASGSDATTVANKLSTSQLFTASLNSSNSSSYNNNSVTTIRDFLAGITTTAASQTAVNTILTTMVAAGGGTTSSSIAGTYAVRMDTGSSATFVVAQDGTLTGTDMDNSPITGSVNMLTGAFTTTTPATAANGMIAVYTSGTISLTTKVLSGTYTYNEPGKPATTGTLTGSQTNRFSTAMLSPFFGKPLNFVSQGAGDRTTTTTMTINADGTMTSPFFQSGTWSINASGQFVYNLTFAAGTHSAETDTSTLTSVTATGFTTSNVWTSVNGDGGTNTQSFTLM